jgi:hypothetical protein
VEGFDDPVDGVEVEVAGAVVGVGPDPGSDAP